MAHYEYMSPQQVEKSDRYPFSIGQLRYHLNRRHITGLEKAVRKIGKRLYIRTDLLDSWIESQSNHKGGEK